MQLPEIEFSQFTLENGLNVILRSQPKLPIVATNLWYHVGSKNEERNQRGFAHLFEHLMFEGSEHYPGDFFKHLQPLGANINGSTSSDRTNYFVDLPSAHLERVLAMESDRMAHLVPALDESKLSIQKGVVKNEYRQNYANRPYGMVWPVLSEALYPPQHPYSWLTIGVMEDLDSASLDDVAAFFRRYYVPANASLAVVGDIDLDTSRRLVERYFGAIDGGTKALRPWAPSPVDAAGREIVLQDRVELDRFYAVWHTVPHFHASDAALNLLADVLARGRSSRLYQKLVIDRQLAQDVTAYQSGRELAGTFGISVTLRPSRSIGELREPARDRDRPDREGRCDRAGGRACPDHEDGELPVRARAHWRLRRGRRSAQCLPRFPERPVADHQGPAAFPAGHRGGHPRCGGPLSGRQTQGGAVGPGTQASGRLAAPGPQDTAKERSGGRLSRSGAGDSASEQRDCGLGLAPARPADRGHDRGHARRRQLATPLSSRPAQLAVSMLEEGTTTRSAATIALAAEAMGTGLSANCGWDGAFVSFRCLKAFLEPSLELAVDLLAIRRIRSPNGTGSTPRRSRPCNRNVTARKRVPTGAC